MPSVCSVAVCRASSRVSKVKFHKFPRNQEFQNLWIEKCGRKDDFNPKTGRVCEIHFFDDDYFETKTSGLKKLKPDAIPGKKLTIENQGRMSSRIQRAKTKRKSEIDVEIMQMKSTNFIFQLKMYISKMLNDC